MKRQFSRPRRVAIAAVSLTACALLFHGAVAQALVVRGDDLLYRGQVGNALAHYRRAHFLDVRAEEPVDRYVFASALSRSTPAITSAIALANAFLARNPRSRSVRADLALCELIRKDYRAAYASFAAAARTSPQASDAVFAGWAAARTGSVRKAKYWWRVALRRDARFTPARVALERFSR